METEVPDDITVPEHKRKARRTLRIYFKNIPSCDEMIFLPEEERISDLAERRWNVFGKNSFRHEFRFTPAKGKVVNIYRETYKYRSVPYQRNTRMSRHLSNTLFRPLIPESYASESVVGWAMHQKYQNGLPLNRQESEWTQLGVPLSRATLVTGSFTVPGITSVMFMIIFTVSYGCVNI